MGDNKIIFFGKNNMWGDLALSYLELLNQNITVYRGEHGDPFPLVTLDCVDLIVSFSCPWVLPNSLLNQARVAAINFHPGPPNYPGIGCTNFALYNNEEKFGVTAHHMQKTVDSGDIIATQYFPIYTHDSVKNLTDRTYHYLYYMFIKVMDKIINFGDFSKSSEQWTREPFTRKELNNLCEITADMTDAEVARRLRAVTFPGKPGVFIKLNGVSFDLEIKNDH
jgi:methionyl-tRNA formyltransferase